MLHLMISISWLQQLHHILAAVNPNSFLEWTETNLFDFLQKGLNFTTNWRSGSSDPNRAHLINKWVTTITAGAHWTEIVMQDIFVFQCILFLNSKRLIITVNFLALLDKWAKKIVWK